jgi:hypothetical protein
MNELDESLKSAELVQRTCLKELEQNSRSSALNEHPESVNALLKFLRDNGFANSWFGGVSFGKSISAEVSQHFRKLIEENLKTYNVAYKLEMLSSNGREVITISTSGESPLNRMALGLQKSSPDIRLIIDPSGKLYGTALGKENRKENWVLLPLSLAIFPVQGINSLEDPTLGHEFRHLQTSNYLRRGGETSCAALIRDVDVITPMLTMEPPAFVVDELRGHLFNVRHSILYLQRDQREEARLQRQVPKTKLNIINDLVFLSRKADAIACQLRGLSLSSSEDCYAFPLSPSSSSWSQYHQTLLVFRIANGNWTYAIFETHAISSGAAEVSLQNQLLGLAALGLEVSEKARKVIDVMARHPNLDGCIDEALFRVTLDDAERITSFRQFLPSFPTLKIFDADTCEEALTELARKTLTESRPQYEVFNMVCRRVVDVKNGAYLPPQLARAIVSSIVDKNPRPRELTIVPEALISLLCMCNNSLRSNNEEARNLYKASKLLLQLDPEEPEFRNNFAWDCIQVNRLDQGLYQAYRAVEQIAKQNKQVPNYMLDTLSEALKASSSTSSTGGNDRITLLRDKALRVHSASKPN